MAAGSQFHTSSRMTEKGRLEPVDTTDTSGGFRRILLVPPHSGGGRLTERTPAVQPRRRERVLANDPTLLRGALADQITDHGQPGGDAEPHTQIFTRRQPADRIDHREGGAHRLLGIVLMCFAP